MTNAYYLNEVINTSCVTESSYIIPSYFFKASVMHPKSKVLGLLQIGESREGLSTDTDTLEFNKASDWLLE